MNDNEDKKPPKELTDEALDQVAGGKSVIITNDPPPHEGVRSVLPGAIGGKTGGTV